MFNVDGMSVTAGVVVVVVDDAADGCALTAGTVCQDTGRFWFAEDI